MEQSVTVRYFAEFREQAASDSEARTIASNGAVSAGMLFDEVAAEYGFVLDRASVRPAVNGRYVDWDHALQPDDEVAFLPPVTGG